MVSKKKFTRDMLKMLAERKKQREEAELEAMEREYSDYRNNQVFRGKKKTLWQYET